MNQAVIVAVDYYLPEQVLSNHDLAQEFPEWTVDKIAEKTGIIERRIAADNECASDLGIKAAQKLFARGICKPEEIEFILFCSQSPDYFLPSSACIIQEKLGCSRHIGALDFNLGCSGFVYGLSLAKGLIESGQVKNVLLITADTYSKFIEPTDKTVKTIFGDGAAATLLNAVTQSKSGIAPVAYGTDGRGAKNLIVAGGALRNREGSADPYLRMQGSEIFNFTLQVVPNVVKEALAKAGLGFEQIDLFVFHQANAFMLEHLRKKLQVPVEKFYVAMAHCGNTVSSTIPIALCEAAKAGRLQNRRHVMVIGFGVGYSWAATVLNLSAFIG